MIVPVLLFCLGLVFLIKGGDWFVDGATKIAERFKIPEIIIGATIVSIGTTLPEVMVSATSAVTGHPEIAYGNAIGSVICNTALISAITIAVKPGKVDKKTLLIPVCFFFGAAIFYAIIAYTTGKFDRWTGILLVITFIVYMVSTIIRGKKHPEEASDEEDDEEDNDNNKFQKYPKLQAFMATVWFEIILLIVGGALIAVGADLLVDNGTLIAQALGVPESVIALTFVALGTSLPELVTAITSLAKGHGSLSLGNVIGANLFNIVLVCGVSITLKPFAVPNEVLFLGTQIPMSLALEIPVMFGVMLILTIPSIIKGKLYRWQGILLLAIYVAFIACQFILG